LPGPDLIALKYVAIAACVIFVILIFGCLGSSKKPTSAPDKFNPENLTARFVAAIPTLTKELNLEVATSKQTEILERADDRSMLGLDLGINRVQISVPVTYRYAVPLYAEWLLRKRGSSLLVRAPSIQSSLPPAIHTDGMTTISQRGWARLRPEDLMEQLHNEITPTLSRYASDPKRIALVREICRESVADFVQRWLQIEGQWRPDGLKTVYVQFADEKRMPRQPTIELLEFS
jgi:hypothetical protein